jgi:hypothetical protein
VGAGHATGEGGGGAGGGGGDIFLSDDEGQESSGDVRKEHVHGTYRWQYEALSY